MGEDSEEESQLECDETVKGMPSGRLHSQDNDLDIGLKVCGKLRLFEA